MKTLPTKIQFGPMNVNTTYGPIYRSRTGSLAPGFSLEYYALDNKYIAHLNGPWDEDSNPEAHGDTLQEAIDNLYSLVREFCEGVAVLHKAII